MRTKLPYYILAILVVIAVASRIISPPPPDPPGPMGVIPTWISGSAVGEMGPYSVNKGGDIFAAVWTDRQKEIGLRSTIVFIDLVKSTSKTFEMKSPAYISSLGFSDDKTCWALSNDSKNIEGLETSILVKVNARTAKPESSSELKEPVLRILLWNAGSDYALCALPEKDGISIARVEFSDSDIKNKQDLTEVPADTVFGDISAVDATGNRFVYSIKDQETGLLKFRSVSTDAESEVQPVGFSADEVPGKVEKVWVSDAGVLVLSSYRGKLHLSADIAGSEKPGMQKYEAKKHDTAELWPTAPNSVKYVFHKGGVELSLKTGKTKQLFDFKDLEKRYDRVKETVSGGRLYDRKDDYYTSISLSAGLVDIRKLTKEGDDFENILPRR